MARVSSPADDPSVLAQGPIRTCIGCRQRDRPAVMLRIVVAQGSAGMVVPDVRRRLPGRGAWLHPSLGCFDAAERRRAFTRSLRAGGALDASMVRQHLLDIGAGTAARTTAPQSAGSPMSRREQVDPT